MTRQKPIDPHLGPQYAGDDEFAARARLHQSRYRLDQLGLRDFRDYGNRLASADALAGFNFYREWPGLLALVKKRFGPKDSPLYYDMLRSQHVPFNFFGPLALEAGGELTHCLIKRISPDMERVLDIRIEHAPPPAKAVLGDNTSFDVYVEYSSGGGGDSKCALGIEVKYTEGPYGYGKREGELMFANDSAYHRVSGKYTYLPGAIERLRKRDLKQLWRNHLLGSAMDLHRFRSVLLYPAGNKHAASAADAYSQTLLPERQHEFVAITFEEWLSTARRIARRREEIAWVEYLSARYDVALDLREGAFSRVPWVVVPIELCPPAQLADQYPACVAAARLDWAAMPERTSMDDMLHLAYAMYDGYRVSEVLGFGHCGDLANARAEDYRRIGRYPGTAAELWCCLFFEARRWSVTDYPERAPEERRVQFDALYGALRAGLRGDDGSVVRMRDGVLTRWLGSKLS